MLMLAEYVIGGIQNRNKIYEVNNFSLNGIRNECYRSLFLFDKDLKFYVERTGSVKGFAGLHTADAFVFDFDSEDLDTAKREASNFCDYLFAEFDLPSENLRISFSGSKGFHICIPCEVVGKMKMRNDFSQIYKNFCCELAEGFKIDTSIYELRRIFRMVNTINDKSGLYKIPLTYSELKKLSIEEIKSLAKHERNIEQLPVSEIQINEHLKALWLKWSSYKEKHIQNDSSVAELLNGVSHGGRNNAAIKLAGLLIDKGLNENLIEGFLSLWNEKNSPPIETNELQRLIHGAYKRYGETEKPKVMNFEEGFKIYHSYSTDTQKRAKTGFELIDTKVRGISPGETCCILGRTSVGKSALLQNIGMNYAKESKEPVVFFSMEMPITSVIERAIQIEFEITGYEIENSLADGDMFRSESILNKAKALFTKIPNFYTIEKSGLNLASIKSIIEFCEHNIYYKKTGLVLIDYLGLITEKGANIYEAMSRVARGVKDVAKDLNVPIIYLNQVNNKYSEYDALDSGAARDSGSIIEASDFVLGIWKKRTNEESSEIPMHLGIIKNRKGGTGVIDVTMSRQSLRFTEIK